MNTSLKWLNQYLTSPIDAIEAERLLTDQGFPIEGVEQLPTGDTMIDVEVTSNRGDCLSHVGVAREVAAGSGEKRQLKLPDCSLPHADGPQASSIIQVSNDATDFCPLYTARVIQGVKVGPSPAWLVDALQAVGLRSVNNVVDVTNHVLMELGQPLHAFDLARLQGSRIKVRPAVAGEAFTAIDGTTHKLQAGMLVIADEKSPQAIAGVMGGQHSEVTDATTDIVLEAAIFTGHQVRQTSRGLKLMSDSSYRFERGVDPQGVARASSRAARLILELAGGRLAQGVVEAGTLPESNVAVSLRVARCNELLGLDLSADRMIAILASLGMSPALDAKAGVIACTVPSHRLDIHREVDLIEEVARLAGLDHIPVNDRIEIQVRAPQPHIVARRKLDHVLTACGFYETINFSFMTPRQASPFVPSGHEAVSVDDERRKAEPTLRPSLLPSLLICRKANQDAGNHDIRLFEVASAWTSVKASKASAAQTMIEKRRLALLIDAPQLQEALRQMRGVLDEIASALTGESSLTIQPLAAEEKHPYYQAGATLHWHGQAIGSFGAADRKLLEAFGLQSSMVLAELEIDHLVAAYPPKQTVQTLAKYPGTSRDLSVIVEEAQPWSAIEAQIHHAQLAMLESVEYLTTYRGKPIEPGYKSVSFRMTFRDPENTLRHEQVEPQVEALVGRLTRELSAQLRS